MAGIALTAVILFLVWYFREVVAFILVSAVLAIVFRPVVRRLSSFRIGKFRLPRWASAFLTLIMMWAIFITVCSLFIPMVAGKISKLNPNNKEHISKNIEESLREIDEPLNNIKTYLNNFFPMSDSDVSFSSMISETMSRVINSKTVSSAFSSVLNIGLAFIISFFAISFITFFFMKEDGLFFSMVAGLFPDRYHDNVIHALDKITVLLSNYFRGLLAESSILMLVISITMMIVGMKAEDAFVIGLIMGVMNVIPYAGPLIGGIISVFIGIVTPIEGFTVGQKVLVIIIVLMTIKGMDDFILQPALYSSRVKAHPLEVFLVILLAGSAFGMLGMLLAIPSYTVLRVFAKEFFSEVSLVRKLTENV